MTTVCRLVQMTGCQYSWKFFTYIIVIMSLTVTENVIIKQLNIKELQFSTLKSFCQLQYNSIRHSFMNDAELEQFPCVARSSYSHSSEPSNNVLKKHWTMLKGVVFFM